MILWFDELYEPITTQETAWVTSIMGAACAMEGMPIDIVDVDDSKEGYLFIKMLHDIDYLKDLKQVNIHGHNLLSSYLKEIYQICDLDKVYVTNYLLPPDKMKINTEA